MKNIYYHSTIKIKLDEIINSGHICPGKKDAHDGSYKAEWCFLGQYRKSSPEHIYLWKNLDEAIKCAKFISSTSKRIYNKEEKQPIIIEITLENLANISPDPDSTGIKYLGSIAKNNFSKIYGLTQNTEELFTLDSFLI